MARRRRNSDSSVCGYSLDRSYLPLWMVSFEREVTRRCEEDCRGVDRSRVRIGQQMCKGDAVEDIPLHDLAI